MSHHLGVTQLGILHLKQRGTQHLQLTGLTPLLLPLLQVSSFSCMGEFSLVVLHCLVKKYIHCFGCWLLSPSSGEGKGAYAVEFVR
jgi:hypothetical protein